MVQTYIDVLNAKDYTGTVQKAVEYLLKNKDQIEAQKVGKYEVDSSFFYMVQEYHSKNDAIWESHKKYIDIQWILDGEEIIEISGKKYMKQLGDYDESKDLFIFEGESLATLLMKKNDLTIFYPTDIHKPGLRTSKGNTSVRKCLFKILTEK
ncbi:MAG: YhcH/YjgK/YiaL family protein [Spirochaetota bacterium]|nr:YhcH/YjgK/YiaL family protein [Spirochaetota bacterium]